MILTTKTLEEEYSISSLRQFRTAYCFADHLAGNLTRLEMKLERVMNPEYVVVDSNGEAVASITSDCSRKKQYINQGYMLRKKKLNYYQKNKIENSISVWHKAFDYYKSFGIHTCFHKLDEIYDQFALFVANEIDAMGYRLAVRSYESEWYTEKGFGGRGFENGNRIFIDAGVEGSTIYLAQIVVQQSGYKDGTKALLAMKKYADLNNVAICIYKVCNHKYFSNINWLVKKEDTNYYYKERL